MINNKFLFYEFFVRLEHKIELEKLQLEIYKAENKMISNISNLYKSAMCILNIKLQQKYVDELESYKNKLLVVLDNYLSIFNDKELKFFKLAILEKKDIEEIAKIFKTNVEGVKKIKKKIEDELSQIIIR